MIKFLEIENRRQQVLRGFIEMPKDTLDAPLVILLHGFSGDKSGHKFAHVELAKELVKNGYGCVRMDFAGSGDSDGLFEEMTFTSELEDAEDIYNYIKKLPNINKNKLILMGHSMGGFVAATLAPKVNPYSLILSAPGASMWNNCLTKYEEAKKHGVQIVNIDGLKFDIEFNKDLSNYNPYEDAKGYNNPVLILRGSKDDLVDRETCKKYEDIYVDCNYVEIDEANHNFGHYNQRELHNRTIISHIGKLL